MRTVRRALSGVRGLDQEEGKKHEGVPYSVKELTNEITA